MRFLLSSSSWLRKLPNYLEATQPIGCLESVPNFDAVLLERNPKIQVSAGYEPRNCVNTQHLEIRLRHLLKKKGGGQKPFVADWHLVNHPPSYQRVRSFLGQSFFIDFSWAPFMIYRHFLLDSCCRSQRFTWTRGRIAHPSSLAFTLFWVTSYCIFVSLYLCFYLWFLS